MIWTDSLVWVSDGSEFLSEVMATVGRVIDCRDSELASLLELSAEGVDEAGVVRALSALARAQAMLEAVRLRFVGRLSGLRGSDTAAVVAGVERTSVAKAGGDVELAGVLVSRLPMTGAELAAGRLSMERVRQIARATTDAEDLRSRSRS
jgi:hypothetical protein